MGLYGEREDAVRPALQISMPRLPRLYEKERGQPLTFDKRRRQEQGSRNQESGVGNQESGTCILKPESCFLFFFSANPAGSVRDNGLFLSPASLLCECQ